MRRKEKWQQARELAEQGYGMSETARILGIHHTTAMYIAKQMGFKWVKKGKAGGWSRSETVGRVERMMRLACR